jgi:delta-aminolevulinic acid dehydratase/porphobilinogen synthase
MALFPAIAQELKTPDGREARNPQGLVPRTVRELKKRFPGARRIPTWRWIPSPRTGRTA